MHSLKELKIDVRQVKLVEEGIEKFSNPYAKLMGELNELPSQARGRRTVPRA